MLVLSVLEGESLPASLQVSSVCSHVLLSCVGVLVDAASCEI